MMRFSLQVDDGEVGVVADGDAALAAMPKRRCGPWLVRSTKRSRLRRPALTWSSMIGTSVCTPVMPEGDVGIGLGPFPRACAARGRSRGRRRRRSRTAGPDGRAMALRRGPAGSSAHRCRAARRRSVAEGQVMRRDLDGGHVLVVGEERHLLGGRDVQHVDALAGASGRGAPGARCEARAASASRQTGWLAGSPAHCAGACAPQAVFVLGVEGGAAARWRAGCGATPSSSLDQQRRRWRSP